jgi:hypothetical protein
MCGKVNKERADRFCGVCRAWLVEFARTTDIKTAALDMAQCLAMMLRYGERPNATAK